MSGDRNFNGWEDFVAASKEISRLQAENEKLKEEYTAVSTQLNYYTRLAESCESIGGELECREALQIAVECLQGRHTVTCGAHTFSPTAQTFDDNAFMDCDCGLEETLSKIEDKK